MANKMYIQFWNVDEEKEEWREFSTGDIPFLMEKGIIDEDSLGYYMDDSDAFERALLHMSESNEGWSYERFVDYYLSLTNKELRIKAYEEA